MAKYFNYSFVPTKESIEKIKSIQNNSKLPVTRTSVINLLISIGYEQWRKENDETN